VERIFNREISRKFPYFIQKVALRKLLILDAALSINDLRVPPANHLERLRGKREGQYSIRINDQWRICFVWENGSVFKVEIIDYH
jgi:toxin HigB-1